MAAVDAQFALHSLHYHLLLDLGLNCLDLSLLVLFLHLFDLHNLQLLDRLCVMLLLFDCWNRFFNDWNRHFYYGNWNLNYGLCLQLIDHLHLLMFFKHSLSLEHTDLCFALLGLFLKHTVCGIDMMRVHLRGDEEGVCV